MARSRWMLARAAAVAALGLIVAIPIQPASAQGLFDFLFGGGMRRTQPALPPAAPDRDGPSRGAAPGTSGGQVSSGSGGGAVAFCVRLCDGRYFPLQKSASMSAAESCQAFCPSAQTKVFNGSAIDRAVASDGTRYAGLKTAFLYRDRIPADCTCNGKTGVGLARMDVAHDPTLRPGDIVATREGLQAYNGGSKGGGFTPISAYPGLSKEVRQHLLSVQVSPTPIEPGSSPADEEGFDGADATDGTPAATVAQRSE